MAIYKWFTMIYLSIVAFFSILRFFVTSVCIQNCPWETATKDAWHVRLPAMTSWAVDSASSSGVSGPGFSSPGVPTKNRAAVVQGWDKDCYYKLAKSGLNWLEWCNGLAKSQPWSQSSREAMKGPEWSHDVFPWWLNKWRYAENGDVKRDVTHLLLLCLCMCNCMEMCA